MPSKRARWAGWIVARHWVPALVADAPEITAYLVEQGYLDTDDGMLFIGPEAERRFGHRHFMNLMAVFTAPPELTVLHGHDEIGRVDGPRLLLLGGRSSAVSIQTRARVAGRTG
jgi:ATP-dependent Lhr-like helicase